VPSFYRAFHSRFGTSPARWRERLLRRRPPAPQPPSIRRWQVVTGTDGQLRSVPHPGDSAPRDAGPAARVVVLAPLRIAFLRRTGPGAARHATADFARLVAFAERRSPVTEPLLIRLHHDDPAITPARLQRVDHGIVIGPRRRGEVDIGIQRIGGDEMLVATCNGGPESVTAVCHWLEHDRLAALGGSRGNGPVLEILLDGPGAATGSSLRDVLVPVDLPPTSHPWYWRRRPAPDGTPAPSP
jgi:DNA gyrase inhibitor GyrI